MPLHTSSHSFVICAALPDAEYFTYQALHFLETISPGSLLVQLLSGLLGLSVFVLEEGCSGAGGLPGVQARKD